jgi:hypothetical protein
MPEMIDFTYNDEESTLLDKAVPPKKSFHVRKIFVALAVLAVSAAGVTTMTKSRPLSPTELKKKKQVSDTIKLKRAINKVKKQVTAVAEDVDGIKTDLDTFKVHTREEFDLLFDMTGGHADALRALEISSKQATHAMAEFDQKVSAMKPSVEKTMLDVGSVESIAASIGEHASAAATLMGNMFGDVVDMGKDLLEGDEIDHLKSTFEHAQGLLSDMVGGSDGILGMGKTLMNCVTGQGDENCLKNHAGELAKELMDSTDVLGTAADHAMDFFNEINEDTSLLNIVGKLGSLDESLPQIFGNLQSTVAGLVDMVKPTIQDALKNKAQAVMDDLFDVDLFGVFDKKGIADLAGFLDIDTKVTGALAIAGDLLGLVEGPGQDALKKLPVDTTAVEEGIAVVKDAMTDVVKTLTGAAAATKVGAAILGGAETVTDAVIDKLEDAGVTPADVAKQGLADAGGAAANALQHAVDVVAGMDNALADIADSADLGPAAGVVNTLADGIKKLVKEEEAVGFLPSIKIALGIDNPPPPPPPVAGLPSIPDMFAILVKGPVDVIKPVVETKDPTIGGFKIPNIFNHVSAIAENGVAEHLKDVAKDKAKQMAKQMAKDKAADMAQDAVDKAKDVAEDVGDKMEDAADKAKDMVKDVAGSLTAAWNSWF